MQKKCKMVRKKDSKCSKLCIIQKNAGYAPSSTLVGMFLSKYKKMSTKTRDKYLFGCVDTAAVEGNPLPNWLDYPRKYRAQPPPPQTADSGTGTGLYDTLGGGWGRSRHQSLWTCGCARLHPLSRRRCYSGMGARRCRQTLQVPEAGGGSWIDCWKASFHFAHTAGSLVMRKTQRR